MFNMRDASLSQQDRSQNLGPSAWASWPGGANHGVSKVCSLAATVMGQCSAGMAPKGRAKGCGVTAFVCVGGGGGEEVVRMHVTAWEPIVSVSRSGALSGDCVETE